jgi:histidinol-phosphate aminotransferase
MVTQMFGATAVKVPLDDAHTHDLDAMLAAITERTRLLFLCNPNNPTGTIYRSQAFDHFMANVPEHVVVVVDEAYYEFVTDSEYPDTLADFDGERPLAVLRTFSKMYSLAGARIGYGALPTALATATHQVREPFNVNSVAQVGAFYSLGDDAEVQRRRTENAAQRDVLCECFERLAISYAPSQTNFVYFTTTKPREVFEALLAEGIIARDFGTAPALRIGVGTPEDTEYVCAAFESVVDTLGGI